MDKDNKPRPQKQNARQSGWYMRGWQKEDVRRPDGKVRTDWVYRGAWYDLPPEAPRMAVRVTAAVCALVLAAVYIIAGLYPSQGSLVPYVAYPYFLGLLPLLYFLMGAFWVAYTPGAMTYRRYHASFLRLRAAAWAGVIWTLVPIGGELVFLLTGSAGDYGRELAQLLSMLVCEGQYIMALRLTKKYPVTELDAK